MECGHGHPVRFCYTVMLLKYFQGKLVFIYVENIYKTIFASVMQVNLGNLVIGDQQNQKVMALPSTCCGTSTVVACGNGMTTTQRRRPPSFVNQKLSIMVLEYNTKASSIVTVNCWLSLWICSIKWFWGLFWQYVKDTLTRVANY